MRKLLMTIAAGGALMLAGAASSQPAAANGLAEPASLVKVGYFKHYKYGKRDRFGNRHFSRRHFRNRGIRRYGGFDRYHGLRSHRFGGLRGSRVGYSRFHGFRGGYGRFR